MSDDAIRETWRAAALDATRCLNAASMIEAKTYPAGDAPEGLLPALVVAVALCRLDAHASCLRNAEGGQ